MRGAAIEIPSIPAEDVHRRAVQIQKRFYPRNDTQRQSLLNQGFRAARARDPRLLKLMDRVANEVDKTAEAQYGRTRRDPGTTFSERTESTEAQLWREAYRLADQGAPGEQFAFLYAAAASFLGLAM